MILLIFWVGYLTLFGGYRIEDWPEWTFFGKTLWDWMGLLIIPIVLAIGGFLLQRSERKTDRDLAEQSRLAKTLDDYLTAMKALILDDGLLEIKKSTCASLPTLRNGRKSSGGLSDTHQFLQQRVSGNALEAGAAPGGDKRSNGAGDKPAEECPKKSVSWVGHLCLVFDQDSHGKSGKTQFSKPAVRGAG